MNVELSGWKTASRMGALAALVFACAPSWALVADSDYLHAVGTLPTGWTLATQGPTLNWQCTGPGAGDCSFSGSLTASVLIKPDNASAVASDAFAFQTTNLRVFDSMSTPVELLDPNGHSMGYYAADISKWTLRASGTVGSVPANSLFMTAYGNHVLTATSNGVSFGQPLQLLDGSTSQVTWSVGPGSAGMTGIDFAPVSRFTISEGLYTPYYAYPSTTNPRCKDLSCLDYAAPVYTPDAYVLTFDLVSVPSPAVPEPSAAILALAGLSVLAFATRRRQA